MKVLTIKQPFAELIKNNIKTIETRSWKTNYRGEIYIHAGKRKIDKKTKERLELSELYDAKMLDYGKIICKCNLIDCIYMDEEYIKKLKKDKNNFVSGRYEIGRYAWILSDIYPLENKISINGQLGIWNYNK